MAISGWIKVHRALSEHHIASDPAVLSVWLHLLMMANHVESKRLINGRVTVIAAGQLITSRKSLSEKTGVQESKVERILKMLKSEQQIEQHGSSKFRVISILNWHEYQAIEQKTEQQVNSTRTTDEQQMNTLEEVLPIGNTEECKEGEEKNIVDPGKQDRVKVITAKQLEAMGVDQQHARDWLEARKAKRLKLTQTALDGVASEAEKAGLTLAQAIAKSAAEGWAGFKASWLDGSKPNGKPSMHHGFDQIDYMQGVTGENEDGSFRF